MNYSKQNKAWEEDKMCFPVPGNPGLGWSEDSSFLGEEV
jgi:hypothetical protein